MRLGRFAFVTLGTLLGALLIVYWMRGREMRLFPVSSMNHDHDDHQIVWIPLN